MSHCSLGFFLMRYAMSLSPSRLSSILRSVAARIDASKRPSKTLVAHELRRVLAAVENGLKGAIENALKQAMAMEGKGGDFSIGTGADLFPEVADLDESSYYIMWNGDSSEPMAVQAQHKHDVDVVFELTLLEAQEDAGGMAQRIEKAILADAQGGQAVLP